MNILQLSSNFNILFFGDMPDFFLHPFIAAFNFFNFIATRYWWEPSTWMV